MSLSKALEEFNEGHIVEALDRCHWLLHLNLEMLHLHPAIRKAGCQADVERISEELAEIYQKIGRLEK